MINNFELLIKSIVNNIKCSPHEKQNIELELRDHLYTSYEQYKHLGNSHDEAINLAVQDFGQPQQILYQYEQSYPPINKMTKSIIWFLFLWYLFYVINRLFVYRIIRRISDYIRADGPYTSILVRTNPDALESKQFFDFSLWKLNINLQPFETIIFYLTTNRVNTNTIIDNLLGNILLYLPLGLLLPFLFYKCRSFYFTLFIAALASFGTEIIQFGLQLGIADIDDVILNLLGATIGYLLAKLILTFTSFRSNRKLQLK